MNNDTLAWLRWTLIPNLGLKRSHQLLDLIDSPESLFLHPDRWPLPESVKQTIREMNLLGDSHLVHQRALDQLAWAESANHNLLFMFSDNYPANLADIDDAPLVLWANGQVNLLKTTQIAMVGSRHASPNALRHTRNISRDLAQHGLTLTSGGAKGIDRACHEAAIDCGGKTIAVLGCGIDVVYPRINQTLFQKIAEQGLLLSEYPLGTQPRPGHFPRRNRIISALSSVVAVMEAELKSGSLVTAAHALQQGRDIYAMPGDVGNPNCEGCHKLIQDGAYLLHSAADILGHLQLGAQHSSKTAALIFEHLSPLQKDILNLLRGEPMSIDTLSFQLKLSSHKLLEPILELELEGLIEQQPGGYCLSDVA